MVVSLVNRASEESDKGLLPALWGESEGGITELAHILRGATSTLASEIYVSRDNLPRSRMNTSNLRPITTRPSLPSRMRSVTTTMELETRLAALQQSHGCAATELEGEVTFECSRW